MNTKDINPATALLLINHLNDKQVYFLLKKLKGE